jgi:hypothetical protein
MADDDVKRHGGIFFRREVKQLCGHTVHAADTREMEALRIINPTRTEAGWRVYSVADIRAAAEWLIRRRAESPRRRSRRRSR